MKKKVLFCATVDYHIKAFHLPYLKWFQEQGWEVHVAANGELLLPYVDKKFNICIERSPFRRNNLKAFKELKKIISDNKYDIIHCHTPLGGVLTRLAARAERARGTKVIYTAHGFHFFNGAPIINWIVYFPIEKWLSRFTDCLITINSEDYKSALSYRFRMERLEQVNGVGVNSEKFKPVNDSGKKELRKKHSYEENDFLMVCVAELNKNKNQEFLIKNMSKLKELIPSIRLLLVGKGEMYDHYKSLSIEENVEDHIDFLGYREDINEIYPMCDIAVATSFREGLPVNIIESMCCGLPIVASVNRGHVELVEQNKNGHLFNLNSSSEFIKFIFELFKDRGSREQIHTENLQRAEAFTLDNVLQNMSEIYLSVIEGD